MQMPLFLALFGAVLWLWTGCGRSAPPPVVGVGSTNNAAATVASGTEAAGVLAELTQALRKYSVEQRRVPATLNELVVAGYIQNLPQPPDGKVFAIDAKNVQVILK